MLLKESSQKFKRVQITLQADTGETRSDGQDERRYLFHNRTEPVERIRQRLVTRPFYTVLSDLMRNQPL